MEQVIHFKYVHIREHGTAPQFPFGGGVSTSFPLRSSAFPTGTRGRLIWTSWEDPWISMHLLRRNRTGFVTITNG